MKEIMALREVYEKARQHKLLIWTAIVFALALVLTALFGLYLVLIYPVNQLSQYGSKLKISLFFD